LASRAAAWIKLFNMLMKLKSLLLLHPPLWNSQVISFGRVASGADNCDGFANKAIVATLSRQLSWSHVVARLPFKSRLI